MPIHYKLPLPVLFALALPVSGALTGCNESSFPAEASIGTLFTAQIQPDGDLPGEAHLCRQPPRDLPDCRLVPADHCLNVPADECLKLQLKATGVQIYTCTATTNAMGTTTFNYALKAPEANLYNDWDQFVGNHFLGPTWQYRDGSKVHGAVDVSIPAPEVSEPNEPNDNDDINWLLLHVASVEGNGMLDDILHIQRIHTSDGKPPTMGCSSQKDVGTEVRVPYTADYYFYHAKL